MNIQEYKKKKKKNIQEYDCWWLDDGRGARASIAITLTSLSQEYSGFGTKRARHTTIKSGNNIHVPHSDMSVENTVMSEEIQNFTR